MARRHLDPGAIQIFVVGDKNTPVKGVSATERTLAEDLEFLANDLRMPFKEIELR